MLCVFRSYQHAFPSDLFNAFEKAVQEDNAINSFISIAGIMRYWVEQPGYPLINVNVNMDTGVMSLTQVKIKIDFNNKKQTHDISTNITMLRIL